MKTEKKRQLKGSVLFTVVCVMSLLIIFLMGTLVLAASTNRRAHKSYSSSQTSYTTRAAIESFASAMEQEVAIASAVENLGSAPIYPQIVMPDGTMGHIGYYNDAGVFQEGRIKVECLEDSESQYYFDNDPVDPKWVQLQTVKVTATARLGGEESTTVAYIRKKAPNEPTPLAIKGLQTVGSSTVNSGGTITGGLGLGIVEPVAESDLSKVINLETDMAFINSDLKIDGAGINIHVTKPGTGTVIMGSARIQNSQVVTLDYAMDEDYTQNKIPYFYVDEVFTTSANATLNLVDTDSSLTSIDASPYNLFFGSINLQNSPVTIKSADLYLMDEGVTSYMTKQSGSYLQSWNNSVYNKTEAQHYSEGGNIYSKGSLNLAYIEIEGDVRVVGDVTIGPNVKITGDLVVGGALNYDTSMIVEGNIYCDPTLTNPPMENVEQLNEGVTRLDNVYVEESLELKDGYKAINNNYYDYNVSTVDYGSWVDTVYTDKWGNRVYPSDPAAGYYVEIDIYGTEIGSYPTNEPFSFYTDDILNPVRVNKWEATTTIPAHYLKVDATGAQIVPDVETDEAYSYFDAAGNAIDYANAVSSVSPIKPLEAYDDDIYPANMTREEITGLGDPANKIVTTLSEMQEAIGYSASTGTFNANVYRTEIPDSVTFPTSATNISTTPNIEITENSWITTSEWGVSNPNITIKPNGQTLWIKLDNFKASNDANVFIDTSAGGTVNFLVTGDFSANKWKMTTSTISEGSNIYCDYVDSTGKAYPDTEIDINWYGSVGSTISVVNNSTFLGTAKMPYTTINVPVSGAYNVVYNDVEESYPVWIGNALFEGVDSANQFKLLYTGSGGSSDSDLDTELGMWHINYFDQY